MHKCSVLCAKANAMCIPLVSEFTRKDRAQQPAKVSLHNAHMWHEPCFQHEIGLKHISFKLASRPLCLPLNKRTTSKRPYHSGRRRGSRYRFSNPYLKAHTFKGIHMLLSSSDLLHPFLLLRKIPLSSCPKNSHTPLVRHWRLFHKNT
jgi:hypothetical protein